MKKLLSILASVVIAASVSAFPLDSSASSAEAKSATEIINDITTGWNLGGSLDNYTGFVTDDPYAYELSMVNPVTYRETIQAVHAAGFNAIRIPVTWEQKLDENDQVKDFWMDRVQEVVDYA